MSDPTPLGSLRTGSDPRVPGLLAELEQLRSIAAAAQGVAARALGMVEGVAARLEHVDAALERLDARLEQPPVEHKLDAAQLVDAHGDPLPSVAEVVEHLGELEQRQTLLAKALVKLVPGAAAALRAG